MKQATLNQRRGRSANTWRVPVTKLTLAFVLALLSAIILSGCSTANSNAPSNNGDTTSQGSYVNYQGLTLPYKPVTHLRHRSVVSNFYAGALDVVDAAQSRITTFAFPVGGEPTYLQPSRDPDVTFTFVNNTESGTLSSFDNYAERVKATVNLAGATESFAISADNQSGFAAVPAYNNGSYTTPGAIVRFNPTDGSLNTAVPFPTVRYLALDTLEKHLFAFEDLGASTTNLCGNTVANSDIAYWVDLNTTDPNTQLPVYYPLCLSATGPTVPLSRPVATFFSADNTKAYILSCGSQCGGTAAASVTEIDVTSIVAPVSPATAGRATVLNQWTQFQTCNLTDCQNLPIGARIGMIDTTTNMLYVAGSTATSTGFDCAFSLEMTQWPTGCGGATGGNSVQNGVFTAINLSTNQISNYVRTGNGTKRWIRNINGKFWVASLNCGVQSCVTLINPNGASTVTTNPAPGVTESYPLPGSATVLANANGSATGISLQAINSNSTDDVYTIEGGELFIYDQTGKTVTSQNDTDVKGQAWDVLYIN